MLNSKKNTILSCRNICTNNSGYSLIELVAVIVLVSLLVIGIEPILFSIMDVWQMVSFREQNGAEMRIAIDWMEREIRTVKDEDSILVADDTDFHFLDNDDNDIRFYVSGGNLYRNSRILCGNVIGLGFYYYDGDNQLLATPLNETGRSEIRRIEIDLVVQAGSESLYLSSGVYLRNLKGK